MYQATEWNKMIIFVSCTANISTQANTDQNLQACSYKLEANKGEWHYYISGY